MEIAEFKIERYFARWEFAIPYILGASDVEGYRLQDVLALADAEGRRLWEELTLGYTESEGHPALRSAIADLYQRISPNEILVCSPVEAIFLFWHAVLGPGDHAIVVRPAYQALYEVARSITQEVSFVSLRPENGWQLDIEAVRAAVRPATRAIAINFPHNPTGAMIDTRTFAEIVAIAREAGAWLFSDEMYRFLEFEPSERLPAGADAYERGVSLGGMSKSLAMGGLRIGWLATQNRELLARMERIKDYTSICSSAPSQILAVIALRAREKVLQRSRDIVLRNLARLDRFFAEWSDVFTWIRPRGGSVAFPSLRSDWSVEEFSARLADREGVLVVPGTIFDFPGNHFRVGLGRPSLPEALERVERLTSQLVSFAHP